MASEGVRHVGVAMDYSEGSKYALKWALNNLVKKGDHIIIIIVSKNQQGAAQIGLWEKSGSPLIPLREFGDTAVAKKYGVSSDVEIQSLLEDEAHQKEIVPVFKIYWGDAREKLCDAITDVPLDFLVMGSRGLGTLKRALLGSVSNYVLNHAPCPITVVKTPHTSSSSHS